MLLLCSDRVWSYIVAGRMCSKPMTVTFKLAKRFSMQLVTRNNLRMDARKSLRDSPTRHWMIPSNVTGPFSIVLTNKEMCRQWNIEEFKFTLVGVKEFSVFVDNRHIIKSVS